MNAGRFKDLLLEERARVVAALDHLHGDHPGSLEDETGEQTFDNHLADAATATLDREIDYSLEENEVRMLAAIDAALARIEEASYGRCEQCGKEIEEERLEAIPWTTLCIDDKRKDERG